MESNPTAQDDTLWMNPDDLGKPELILPDIIVPRSLSVRPSSKWAKSVTVWVMKADNTTVGQENIIVRTNAKN